MRAEIIVIDDQAGPRESLRMILKETHNVRIASGGREGIQLVEELEPDLLFVDVKMPEMDGLEVLKAVRSSWPDVQVAMITAFAAVDTAQVAIREGAMDYITKPFTVPDVEAVVERALQQRRERREQKLLELQLREIGKALAGGIAPSGEAAPEDRGAIVEGLTSARDSIQAQMSHFGRLNALGEIAAEVNHDMNNLLSTILLTIELLLRRMEMGQEVDMEELSGALRTIESAAQDGSSATQRIREFLKADPFAPREMVDLSEIVASSIQLSTGRVGGFSSRHEMINEMPELPQVFGNSAALRAVFTNILINARQALGNSGTVRVTGHEEGDFVVVSVEDNGVGMPPEVIARATSAFFTTKGETGTGLGLSLANKILTQHCGRLEIASEPGVGTKVSIWLPTSRREPVDTSEGNRVLVVDDDEGLVELVCQVLRAAGFEAVPTTSGEDAWEEFSVRRRMPDEEISVVLTDLDMPGTSGGELARRVKTASPTTPVVALSGVPDAEELLGDNLRYVDSIIRKPFQVNALVEALHNAARLPA